MSSFLLLDRGAARRRSDRAARFPCRAAGRSVKRRVSEAYPIATAGGNREALEWLGREDEALVWPGMADMEFVWLRRADEEFAPLACRRPARPPMYRPPSVAGLGWRQRPRATAL